MATDLELDVCFWKHVNKTDTCWLWTGALPTNGYACLHREGRTQTGSRYAWIKTFGPIAEGLCVCHKCDNPKCVNISHLFLGTMKDNAVDRGNKNREASGDRNGRRTKPERTARGVNAGKSKLTFEQVLAIRLIHKAGGTSIAKIAREYGLSWNAIKAIVEGRVWKTPS
jgi:hypothetical protein